MSEERKAVEAKVLFATRRQTKRPEGSSVVSTCFTPCSGGLALCGRLERLRA